MSFPCIEICSLLQLMIPVHMRHFLIFLFVNKSRPHTQENELRECIYGLGIIEAVPCGSSGSLGTPLPQLCPLSVFLLCVCPVSLQTWGSLRLDFLLFVVHIVKSKLFCGVVFLPLLWADIFSVTTCGPMLVDSTAILCVHPLDSSSSLAKEMPVVGWIT